MNWTVENIGDLTGKIIVVTGGNSGLGYEAVKAFAAKNAEVIMASRSTEKAEAAKAEIVKSVPDGNINVMQLDLGDLDSVKSFATAFKKNYKKLDVLLNNAGIMMSPYSKTKDGFESQNGINHLGHFALTGLLLDVVLKTPGSRIVNVSSAAHKSGKMDFDNYLFENGKAYSPMKSYGRSKLSNLLFTYELQRKLEAAKKDTITVAAHPGFAMTNIMHYLENKWVIKMLLPLVKNMAQDQAMGALPEIRASVDPAVKGSEYYGPDGKNERKGYPVIVSSNEASHDLKDAASLWEASEKLTGVQFKF